MDFSFICKNVPEDGKPWLSSHPSMTETAQGGAAMQSCASALAVRDSSTARHPSPASWTASAGGEDRSLCHQLWRCQSRWYRVPANSRNPASAWVCVGVRTSGTGPLGSRTMQADLSEVKIQEEAWLFKAISREGTDYDASYLCRRLQFKVLYVYIKSLSNRTALPQ